MEHGRNKNIYDIYHALLIKHSFLLWALFFMHYYWL